MALTPVPGDESQTLPSLTLVTFGPPTALVAGRVAPSEVLWRKHLALLIYLALSPNFTRARSHLLGLLWSEKDEALARHSLSEAIRRLRGCLGPGRIITERDTVTLERDGLEVDALGAARHGAEDLGRRSFLEGFTVEQAPAFEEWASAERVRLKEQEVQGLVALAGDLLARGQVLQSRETARRALVLDPHGEPAIRTIMEAAVLAGDSTGALAEYQSFTAALTAIGERPGRPLEELARRIREGSVERGPRESDRTEPPLVGRGALIADLGRWLPGAQSGGGAVVALVGEPGMGRTRLMAELLARASLRGAVVARFRPNERDQGKPWSTLRGLIRSRLVEAPGIPGTSPGELAVMASLVPELSPGQTPVAPGDETEVGLALGGLLDAVSSEAPVVLGLDDAHLADPASIRALQAAMERHPDAPVVLILTILADDEDAPRELHQLLAEVGRGLPGVVSQLTPLPQADLRELVTLQATWCGDADDRDRLTRRLELECAGRPLLAVTLLRGLNETASLREDALLWPPANQTLDSPLPMEIPQLIHSSIRAQLSHLGPGDTELLAKASLLGVELDLPLLEELTGLGRGELIDRLSRAERRHLLRAQGEGYAFPTPLLARVLSHGVLTPGQARQWRRRAADALGGRADLSARLSRMDLLIRLGQAVEATELALELAGEALERGDRRALRRAVRLAEDHAESLPEAARVRLERLRQAMG